MIIYPLVQFLIFIVCSEYISFRLQIRLVQNMTLRKMNQHSKQHGLTCKLVHSHDCVHFVCSTVVFLAFYSSLTFFLELTFPQTFLL